MSTNGAFPDEMKEIALFTEALRAAVPTRPDPGLGTVLVPRLAQVARTATLEAETRPSGREAARRPRRRLALVARIAVAAAVIPLALAGLAFAGVTVPGPARDAFHSVGIKLPNQPAEHNPAPATPKSSAPSGGQGGNEVSNAAKTEAKGKGGNSEAAHRHARKQHDKAKGKAKGHGHGKAVGLNDSTPPGQSGQPGPPANSNAGGSSGSRGSDEAASPHLPQGNANGHAKVPPGHSK